MAEAATTRSIYCCGCDRDVEARLTDGAEVYPHRPDLAGLPFWMCDTCGNYVGCHHKTEDRTRPLGKIPSAEIRKARQHCHRVVDPLWKNAPKIYDIREKLGTPEYRQASARIQKAARGRTYRYIAAQLSIPEQEAHMGEQTDIETLRRIYALARAATPQLIRDWAKAQQAAR